MARESVCAHRSGSAEKRTSMLPVAMRHSNAGDGQKGGHRRTAVTKAVRVQPGAEGRFTCRHNPGNPLQGD